MKFTGSVDACMTGNCSFVYAYDSAFANQYHVKQTYFSKWKLQGNVLTHSGKI